MRNNNVHNLPNPAAHGFTLLTIYQRYTPKNPETLIMAHNTVNCLLDELPRGATNADILLTQQSNLQQVSE